MTSKIKSKPKEKKSSRILGILPNLIGGFITILIGLSLIGTISEQLDNAMNCNLNSTIVNVTVGQPKGPTDSFGGGGGQDYHFGGYDGEVTHKSFLSQASIIRTNQSYIGCLQVSQGAQTMLSLVPAFFALGILGAAIATVYGALRNIGTV